ncbi:MAG: type II toxin-antitoxin system VapC family toxin [Candidatus Aminicenantes bacterium]|nr:type II toxin-antitoxin system VapC family toxin [Candidatus Aminicenantes bacterium]
MILYLETSRLVKLFFDEEGSAETRDLVGRADAVAASIVAYAEARAAFARKRSEQEIGSDDFRRLREDFDRAWGAMFVVGLTEPVVRAAGDLAEKHGLRGFDAIHLASAAAVASAAGGAGVLFCTADRKLRAAAKALAATASAEGLKAV